MRSLKQMISEARSRYKPEDGFKPPLIFKNEKTIISVEKGTHPNMNSMLQARLKREGYKAYNIDGEELQLFEPGKIVWNGK